MDLNTTIHLIKPMEVTVLDGEKFMVDFETGKYYVLTGSGTEIWDYIQQDITVEEIIDRLLTIYDTDRETCTKSTVRFLENLSKNHIISF